MKLGCAACTSRLGDLPFDPTSLIPVAAKALMPGGSGSAGGMSQPITVSPTISTQVSPQISPVFQQQFQPSNSPASAGTSQYLPTVQGAASPSGTPVPADMGMPTNPGSVFPTSYNPNVSPLYSPMATGGMTSGQKAMLIGGAALVVLLIAMKKRKGGLRTYSSTSQALAVR